MKPKSKLSGNNPVIGSVEERRGIYLSTKSIRVLLLSMLVIAAGFYLATWKKNVGSSFKVDDLSRPYGYSVDCSFLTGRTTLLFESGRSSQLYDTGKPCIERVVEERWLANDSVVHLVFEIQYTESYSESKSTKAEVIYDFERAELYTLCDLPLWRNYTRLTTANDIPMAERWMSQKEFDEKLIQLGGSRR